MASFTIKDIMDFTEVTKLSVLGNAPPEALEEVVKEMARWASNGVDKEPEVTSEEVNALMTSIVFSQIAMLTRKPPREVAHVLTDLNYDTLRFIKTHIVQQALRLGRATAKIDRLESQLKRLIEG